MRLTPLVYWAQRHEEVYLRVELTDAQNIDIHMQENVLQFRAQGCGAKGNNDYHFSLEFLLPVKPEVTYRSTQRQLNITVQKEQRGWWERLCSQERKPVFLAPDFDRWLDESDAELEIKEKEEKKKRMRASRHKNEGFISQKMVFLFVYNLVQFVGFSWIFINMSVRLVTFGEDSLYDTFHTTSDVMFFCQTLAAVEVLNAAFGIVRTSIVPTVIQVFGRIFILFIIFGSQEEMHNKPVVFFVFYLWSAIEVVRYPFYMMNCVDAEWKILTWLRYTVWIPLYPLGVLAEAVAVIQSIPLFDESKLLSIPLPKAVGTSISFSYFLYLYLVLMFLGSQPLIITGVSGLPGLFFNFRHLYKQRKKHFSKKTKVN